MFFRLFSILITVVVAHSAHAGPWLREKGKTFAAISFTGTYYLKTTSQTYIEYGLTDSTTLIGDLGMARLYDSLNSGYVTASVRRALSDPDASSKWAYELGVGASWFEDKMRPHVRTALSWGKGITWGEKTGWATVEAAAIWNVDNAQHVGKIDATLGINFTDITSGMLQLYTAFSQNSSATIAPSLVFAPKSSRFRIQIGAESKLGDFSNSALKFGLWREF